MPFALLHEGTFDDAEKIARRRIEAGLLLHLADERLAPRLAELDVSPGEVGVAAVLRIAEEDLAVLQADAACDGFNVFFAQCFLSSNSAPLSTNCSSSSCAGASRSLV